MTPPGSLSVTACSFPLVVGARGSGLHCCQGVSGSAEKWAAHTWRVWRGWRAGSGAARRGTLRGQLRSSRTLLKSVLRRGPAGPPARFQQLNYWPWDSCAPRVRRKPCRVFPFLGREDVCGEGGLNRTFSSPGVIMVRKDTVLLSHLGERVLLASILCELSSLLPSSFRSLRSLCAFGGEFSNLSVPLFV